MSKRTLISDVPQTPGGVHLCFGDVSADEIAVDEEISIKSSLFRTSTEPHMKTRSSSRKKSLVTPKTKEKFVVRKSTDLRRFKTVEDRVNALISSPMIEVRRRPLSQSQSFTSMESDQPRTPIHVPKKNDGMAVASRRLSALILSKHTQSMPSLVPGRASVCPGALSRRRASAFHTNTPVRRSEYFGSRSSVAPRTRESPVQGAANLDAEPEPMDDSENIPPGNEMEPAPETVQAEQIEPSSIGEFRVLVDMEAARLKAARAAWEDVVEEEGGAIPDVALDSIRVAVGKCGLLLAKKFPFFHNLIDMADASLNSATEESAPSADINDLLGYWTTIAAEIEQIDSAFERLRVWRENSKWALESRPKTPSRYEAKKETTKPSSRLPRAKALNPSALPKNIVNKIKATPKSSKRLLRSGKKTASKIPAPSVSKRSTFAEFRAQLKAKRAETFKTPEAPKVAKTTSSSRNSRSGVPTSRSALQTPLSYLRQMSPPPRPATGTPMPRIPKAAVSSTPALVAPPAASLNHILSPYSLRRTRASSTAKSTPGVVGARKSVRFPEMLWATPGGHSGSTSGGGGQTLPVTPHTSMTTDTTRRVSKSQEQANSTVKFLIMFYFNRIGNGFKSMSSMISLARRHLSSIKYTKRHEWVSVDNKMGTVGMSKYAVDKLGDIVFIQLPDVGTNVTQDVECGTIESVKAASDFYAPVSGVVKTVNEAIENKPSVLNKSPEDQGWLFKVEITNPVEIEGLMDETEYRKFLSDEGKQDCSG